MKNHTYSKIVHIFAVSVMLVSLLGSYAFADVIWEPENDFYSSRSNECEYVNRDYYANGENGYLEIFSKPGGKSLGFAENGELFHVQFSYVAGSDIWGLAEYGEDGDKLESRGDGDSSTGWFKLDDAELKYDSQSFREDHEADFTDFDGDYTYLLNTNNIVIWTFPNSGKTCGNLDGISEDFEIQSVYTDLDGLEWGYVSYYYGTKDFWICLSDPTNENIAAKDVPSPVFVTPSPDYVPEASSNSMTTIIIICVAAAILCAAVAISVTNKKKVPK